MLIKIKPLTINDKIADRLHIMPALKRGGVTLIPYELLCTIDENENRYERLENGAFTPNKKILKDEEAIAESLIATRKLERETTVTPIV